MKTNDLSDFFESIQKLCLPGLWSKGVSLVRTQSVVQDSVTDEEITLRVRIADRPISHKVSLWPQDEDWFCDCNAKTDVCAHVAAAVIALKQGQAISPQTEQLTSKAKAAQLHYRWTRHQGEIHFDRWIVYGEKQEILGDSLVSYMGGMTSGRIQHIPLVVTREDYAVDAALNEKRRGRLDRNALLQVFKALAECSHITLDGQPITVSAKPYQIRAAIREEGEGFRLQHIEEAPITEVFQNGAILCGTTLKGVESSRLTAEEKEMISGRGRYFSRKEIPILISEIIPILKSKIQLEILSQKLNHVKQVPPRIVLQLEKIPHTNTLSVIPQMIYETQISTTNPDEICIPDPATEKMLIRKLQLELQLSPGQRVEFEGEAAVDFTLKLKSWETTGNGVEAFSLGEPLHAALHITEKGFDLSFASGKEGGKKRSEADPRRVLQAWKENQNYVPLLSGGWAPLPKDWLNRYGKRINEMLALKNQAQELPSYLLPQLAELGEELGQSCPSSMEHLKELLSHIDKIQEAPLPPDLTATLRDYQRKGVNWLCFLRDSKMGALLADDMGLGKTLQALCAFQGRSLIIAPTSVLFGWADQIRKFRPNLSISLYHGQKRKLESDTDIILTTYAILRMDREILTQEKWETVILDEAQTIKNPESQVARAAFLLQADFRVALSGTPIENRLTDLWSLFRFINPGLLGSAEVFQEEFSSPISRGDLRATERLRQRIKPFILRRLKKEVAPELPPRTETVLYCELDEQEQEVYHAILASTRKEVMEKLEAGESLFVALELLLRLRQACCHTDLIPGQRSERSSKIELLIQTLENSIASGHRALIFSQWTSYLDLIEPFLTQSGITFSRLDGTTRNRAEVVEGFQKGPGPHVMLISLKAGGLGLTLTAADHIFLMDPWWNPTVEDQAADRSHRIGQVNPVLIHRLVARDTIEDRVLELQKVKTEVATAILKEGGAATSLTREDILSLLS